MTPAREREVRKRACGRCEYCRMTQEIQGAEFHVEHVLPRAKGGSDALDNLALACPSCNLRKADRTEHADPRSGRAERLYHPRRDQWKDHFRLESLRIVGRSAIGRATVSALDFNAERRIAIRQVERQLGLGEESA
jgi:hypothetical protein